MTSADNIAGPRKVPKWHGAFRALKDISLSIRGGEGLVPCGPGGSGKRTALGCGSGLGAHQRRIPLLNDGTVVEEANPETFFTAPREERTKKFLRRMFSH